MTDELHRLFEAEADTILAKDLEVFSLRHRLSERERDVFRLLLGQTVTTEEMAAKLTLSPNTISNHIKSILRKVNVAGKAELVVLFTRFLAVNNAQRSMFSRNPKVIVVDDEVEFSALLQEDLKSRGVDVLVANDPTGVVDMVNEFAPDVVICDIRMPGMDGIQLLQKIRERHPYHPRMILVTGYSEYSKEVTLDEGAADHLNKPVDFDRLFLLVVEHFLAHHPTRGRLFRVEPASPIDLGKLGNVALSDIGYGGCFIQTPKPVDDTPHPLTKVKVGDAISFRMALPADQAPFLVTGEVVWARPHEGETLRQGIGVKFTDIAEEGRASIQSFIRTNRVTSFIPIGKASGY